MEIKSDKGSLMVVEFKNYTQPTMNWSKDREWVSWGEQNNYPHYLIELYRRNATHGAIVSGKAQYVYGKGLKFEGDTVLDQAKGEMWSENANRFEDWDEIYRKTCATFELYNGFAWEIVWNFAKTSFEVFHIDIGKLRRSKCGKKVFYCDAWLLQDNEGNFYANPNPEKDASYKEFPLFNPKIKTTSVFYYKLEKPNVIKHGDLYPEPEYSGGIADIESDIEITNFHYNNLKNGMFASSLVSLFNGEPTEEEKKKIRKMFNYTHTGTMNAGKVILNFVNEGGTPADIKTLTASDLDKMFEVLGKRLQQNIFTAHKTYPVLFGVMTEGSLSDTSGEAVIKKWDQFLRAYVEGRQEVICDQIEWMAELQGMDIEVEVEQTTPVGLELPNDPNIQALFPKETLVEYYSKKYGIEIKPELIAPVTPNATPIAQVNEHLKKLSGRDWQHIKRMIREVQNGKVTREVGTMMLKNGYGLNDEDINTLLATQQSQFSQFEIEEKDDIADLFEKFAIDDNDDEVLEEFSFHDQSELLKKQKFISETDAKVLDMIKGDPGISPESIAKQLQIDPADVINIIAGLVTAGLIVSQSGVLSVTEKGLNKEIDPVETEIYTVYKYVEIDGVPPAKSGSRPFCKKLMALSRAGKRWTREGIDNIVATAKQQMSMPEFDPWAYRGGFYTNPDTNDTTPWCRHKWQSITKVRRKKGGSNG